MKFSEKAISYFCEEIPAWKFPRGVEGMNPFTEPSVRNYVREFFMKYYHDDKSRTYIIGINPGRFGGGLTGLSFTDPFALEHHCGISNHLDKKKELSATFIYKVIHEYGGPEKFFRKFFLSAMFPLAITKDGVNYNYYDSPGLLRKLNPSITKNLRLQNSFGKVDSTVICLGKKNLQYLEEINSKEKLFKKIILLEHPRHIMQYKRSTLDQYILKYLDALRSCAQ